MSPSRALKIFFRRMFCLGPAKLCPLASVRILLCRLMGIQIGSDVYIGDHVTISHRCTIVSHMATSVATPLQRLYPPSAAPVRICDGAWLCVDAILLPGVTVGENAVADAVGGA